MSSSVEPQSPSPDPEKLPAGTLRVAILIGVMLVGVTVVVLHLVAVARTNHVPLASAPRPVTVVTAQGASYRGQRSYVGTIEPWNVARVGPQYVSAYVGTVLVRPGASVKRGEVLATLDCRNASAESKEIAARARALEERQVAIQHESERMKQLQSGGFASENELEQLAAKSSSEKAEAEGLRASLVTRNLEVDDCVLRAPFAGEVGDRLLDPGAYVRPGSAVVTVVDRRTVRITGDAPEADYAVVAPETPVDAEVLATGKKLKATITRRTPAADDSTRTIHFEIDVPNTDRAMPVGTTARIVIGVGEPANATAIPLRAATVRGEKASLFLADNGKAKRATIAVLGERDGLLYLDAKLAAGSKIVLEGRALLEDDDPIAPKDATP
jgi:RND family efflux transporter MFP subunit